jgi:Protein of unknown function (DUF2452)
MSTFDTTKSATDPISTTGEATTVDEPPAAQPLARHVPSLHTGRDAASPYPMSRMAPAFQLVDLAAEIAKADNMIANVTSGKLFTIAEQIRNLQNRAREVLERAKRDADLHRVLCRFEKKPGEIVHLYREEDGSLNFSLFGPTEWKTKPRHTFEGSFRLEQDLSFTPLEEVEARERERNDLTKLLPA